MVAPAEHEQVHLLAALEFDGVTNSLDAADAGGHLIDGSNRGFFTGPWACLIREIVFVPFDLTFTDPNAHRYLGWTLDYTLNGGGAYTSVVAAVADADLPQIWDDTGGDTENFALEVPLNASDYYATISGEFSLLIPADAAVRLRVGTYVSGSLAAVTGLDDMHAYIYGRAHGSKQ